MDLQSLVKLDQKTTLRQNGYNSYTKKILI